MPPAEIPTNDSERLGAIASYACLDRRAESWADDVSQIVVSVTGCSIGLVSIVEREDQWFKGVVGLAASGTSRDEAFCSYTILSREPMIVEDATKDQRFADNPLVTGEPGIRFYAGVPLIDSDGHSLGSLCAIDTVPRSIESAHIDAMRRLASLVVERIELTKRSRRTELQERFDLAVSGSADGLWEYKPATGEVWYSDRFWELLGYRPALMERHVDQWAGLLHPEDKDATMDAIRAHLEERCAYDVEYRLKTGEGVYRWFRARGQAIWDERGDATRMAGSISDIHELKTAQEALLRSRALLQHAGKLARVGGWSYDVVNDHLVWSDEVKALHEVEPEFIPTPEVGIAFYTPESQPIVREAFERCLATGEPFDVAVDFVTAKGNVRRVRSMGSPDLVDGQVVRVSGAFQDITESTQVERRLELATTAGNQGTWDWHVPTGALVVNDLWWSMLGRQASGAAVTIKEFEVLVHPDDARVVQRELQPHFEGRSASYRAEFRMRRGDDDGWTWVLSTGRVIERSPEGEPLRMVGVHTDITEQRQSREELEALEQRLRLFVEHTPAAVAMLDREMRYLVASEGWFTQYGLAEAELIGRSHYEVFPTVPDRWKKLHARALAGEILSADRDYFDREGGGETWVRWQLRPWHDERGEIGGIVMFTEVINEQIEHERRLEESMRAAESANLAKSEFLANMSHEIRTPMTAILGFADVLREDGDLELAPESRIECIDTMRRNGSHLLAIINDILDMSKIEAGKMTVERVETSIVTIVEEVVSLMRVRARGKGIDLRIEYRTGMPTAFSSDPTRLRQIVTNLVGNAIKFTEIGSVTLALSCDAEGGSLAIDIIDTGIGMDEHQLASVLEFGAFVQADSSMTRRFGGTGLGLRISHALAQMLGGGISATSIPGEGTTFTLRVRDDSLVGACLVTPGDEPREQPCAGSDAKSATAGADSLDGLRILLAEDGPDNQRLIGFHLRKAGAEVTIADNGAIAVQRVHEQAVAGETFDVILMDMQMPELDGYGATRELRFLGHTTPILALTAHAMDGDREKCLDAGCDDYLTKPINKSKLIERCAWWAGHRGDRAAA